MGGEGADRMNATDGEEDGWWIGVGKEREGGWVQDRIKRAYLFVVCWEPGSGDEHQQGRFRFTFINPILLLSTGFVQWTSQGLAQARERSRDTHEWDMDRSAVKLGVSDAMARLWTRLPLPLRRLPKNLKFFNNLRDIKSYYTYKKY